MSPFWKLRQNVTDYDANYKISYLSGKCKRKSTRAVLQMSPWVHTTIWLIITVGVKSTSFLYLKFDSGNSWQIYPTNGDEIHLQIYQAEEFHTHSDLLRSIWVSPWICYVRCTRTTTGRSRAPRRAKGRENLCFFLFPGWPGVDT